MKSTDVKVVLLDIEGTTTPKNFVYRTLFPYARERFHDFLRARFDDPDVRGDVALLLKECGVEEGGARDARIALAHQCAMRLMDQDRKSTGLKSLQGKIWDAGFADGTLRADLFPDVFPAMKRWKERGKSISIYSSGSIQAQKLLFSHTGEGDLTPYLSRYFDTTSGPKIKRESYLTIARALEVRPEEVLFVSDAPSEITAAESAEMEVRWCVREGEAKADPLLPYPIVRSFDEID